MARVRVVVRLGGHRLEGDGELVVIGNRFLVQLDVRCFSPATVRAYAFDLANFAGFLADRSLTLAAVAPTDLFGYLDWQSGQRAASADTRRIWADLTGPSSIEERREGGHIAFRRDPDQPAAVVATTTVR